MENNEPRGELKSIRTLQTDIQEIKKRGIPLADIVAEAEKKEGFVQEKTSKFSTRQIVALVVAVVVIVGIGLGIFWLFSNRQKENQPVDAGPKSILVSDEKIKDISPDVGPAEFLKTLGANPPAELIDSLGNRFMLAKIYLAEEWTVSIFSIDSYESAFAGMLKWEKDIGGNFQDREIQSHDARVGSGLIYSFINRNFLVITQDEEPLKEIFRRFSSPQYLNVL